MGQVLKYSEPTIWALRKARKNEKSAYFNEPIVYGRRYNDPKPPNAEEEHDAFIRKGSAENPGLNILDPQTGFLAVSLASDKK